jgi:hypothetical protein
MINEKMRIDNKMETIRTSAIRPAQNMGDRQIENLPRLKVRRDILEENQQSFTRDTILRLIQVIKEI